MSSEQFQEGPGARMTAPEPIATDARERVALTERRRAKIEHRPYEAAALTPPAAPDALRRCGEVVHKLRTLLTDNGEHLYPTFYPKEMEDAATINEAAAILAQLCERASAGEGEEEEREEKMVSELVRAGNEIADLRAEKHAAETRLAEVEREVREALQDARMFVELLSLRASREGDSAQVDEARDCIANLDALLATLNKGEG